ncbi:MAG: hypothetical protein WKF47_02960 [Geodermatophilaceae bacterium]
MRVDPLGDDRLDVLPRIEAGQRVLEDHLHPLAGMPQLLAIQLGDVDAVEDN